VPSVSSASGTSLPLPSPRLFPQPSSLLIARKKPAFTNRLRADTGCLRRLTLVLAALCRSISARLLTLASSYFLFSCVDSLNLAYPSGASQLLANPRYFSLERAFRRNERHAAAKRPLRADILFFYFPFSLSLLCLFYYLAFCFFLSFF
jgi:hypothetical protein